LNIRKTKEVPDVVDDTATGIEAKKERVKLNLSLRQMGALLSTSQTYVFDLERGHRSWNEDIISRYVTALKKHKKKASK